MLSVEFMYNCFFLRYDELSFYDLGKNDQNIWEKEDFYRDRLTVVAVADFEKHSCGIEARLLCSQRNIFLFISERRRINWTVSFCSFFKFERSVGRFIRRLNNRDACDIGRHVYAGDVRNT